MNKNLNPSGSWPEYPNRYGYILHLWNSPGCWRASLEDLETGKRAGFESLEQLFSYLMDRTEGRLRENTENGQGNQSSTEDGSCGCSSADSTKTQ